MALLENIENITQTASTLINLSTTTTDNMIQSRTALQSAMIEYSKIHGPIALAVCVIGVVVNIINIVVLSDKEMVSSVNRLLQAIAVADLITMMTYIPYSLLFFIIHGQETSPERNTHSSACFLYFHALCSIISHTASIWLTVSVALFRYIYLSSKNGRVLCSLTRANLTIGLVILVSILLNVPQILVLNISEYKSASTNLTWWYVSTNGMPKYNKAINTLQYIVMAVLVKIGPIILLILLSTLLIVIILKVQKRYHKIQHQRGKGQTVSGNEKKRQEQTNQTTQLLIGVAIVFTMVELPQGILFACNGLSPKHFEGIYYPLGNLFDLITIISCGINFVLYCAMSTQFRKIFVRNLTTLLPMGRCMHESTDAKSLTRKSTSGSDETHAVTLSPLPIRENDASTAENKLEAGDACRDDNVCNGNNAPKISNNLSTDNGEPGENICLLASDNNNLLLDSTER